MAAAVETFGLTKAYNGKNAVDSLSLSVPEGAVYGFLGPNGAGKTTTLKMLAALARPDSGTIRISGKDVEFGKRNDMPAVGFLPDVPGFYDWMDAKEYLLFCGSLFGTDRQKVVKKADELLKTVGLYETGKKRIGGYSRGMKQRLGIAQALINDPGVILLDEPVSALDPAGRKEVMDIISGLSGRVTVFFSTHVLADVERVCDRIVIIKDGKALLEDTLENIKLLDPSREIDIETEEDISPLALMLERSGWADKILLQNNRKLALSATDMNAATRELPGMISAAGLSLRKFNVKEPSMEDIFLKAVNGK